MGVCVARNGTWRLGVRLISSALLLGLAAAGTAQAKPSYRPYSYHSGSYSFRSDCSRHFDPVSEPSRNHQVKVYTSNGGKDSAWADVVVPGQVLQIGQAADHEVEEAIHWMKAYHDRPQEVGGDLLRAYDPASVVFVLTAGTERGTSVPGFDGVLARVIRSSQGSVLIEPIARVSLKATVYGDESNVERLLDKGLGKSNRYSQHSHWDSFVSTQHWYDLAEFRFFKRALAIGVKAIPTMYVIHAPNETVLNLEYACQLIREITKKIKNSQSFNRLAQVAVLGSHETFIVESMTSCLR